MNMHIKIYGIIFLIVSVSSSSPLSVDAQPTAKPNCPSMCGNVSIPSPFGIGKGCYQDDWYEIACNNITKKPFLTKFNTELLMVNTERAGLKYSTITVMNPVVSNCGRQRIGNNIIWSSSNFTGSPYAYDFSLNKFVVVGCDHTAQLVNYDKGITIGCLSSCRPNASDEGCNGFSCCKSSFTSFLHSYDILIEESSSLLDCTYAFLGDTGSIDSFKNNTKQVPVRVRWVVGKEHCEYYDPVSQDFCECPPAHIGNPYLRNGCKVPVECANCKRDCHGIPGTQKFRCGHKREIIIGSSLGAGLIFLLSCGFCIVLFKQDKKKRIKELKKKFFKRNGGLLLEQQILSDEGTVRKTILFSSDELLKATDNFHEDRILGKGGQGTVYKGMLVDGRVTAVKKSKLVDESQLEQFINEVVILSQMNHRNIVKLLGCCLETEVPLLVYEFVVNGNLYELIHNKNEEFPLSWKMRMQIAKEVAGGLAYLHSASSIPIYHRDIKSTNILLDEKFKAKISDFGTSRSIKIEQTHLTTLVYGTFGYLDPEYFRSSQFTDKSDVYSFGVVLAELLTGRKPVFSLDELEEQRGLAAHFISFVEQMQVFDIVDARIIEEAPKEEVLAVSKLAKRCLNVSGKNRPTMKEVMMNLEVISKAPTILESA